MDGHAWSEAYEPVEEEHRLYASLTCPANGIVGPVDPKSMPVLLTNAEEWRIWLKAPADEALVLHRHLADDDMKEVARGRQSDGD